MTRVEPRRPQVCDCFPPIAAVPHRASPSCGRVDRINGHYRSLVRSLRHVGEPRSEISRREIKKEAALSRRQVQGGNVQKAKTTLPLLLVPDMVQ